VEAFVPDPAQAKEVAQLPPHPQLKIELDAFWTSTQIGDGPRPWFAKLALAVDAASGIIFQFEMESPDISLPATAGRCLLKTLPALGCRPAVVYVSPSLFESLAPLVAATGICFKPVPDLPMIEVARSELEPQLGC
jgi:hypothetical protein